MESYTKVFGSYMEEMKFVLGFLLRVVEEFTNSASDVSSLDWGTRRFERNKRIPHLVCH